MKFWSTALLGTNNICCLMEQRFYMLDIQFYMNGLVLYKLLLKCRESIKKPANSRLSSIPYYFLYYSPWYNS